MAETVFKFLNSGDIDYVLKEKTIVMSRLSYFRDLEAKSGKWIGDQFEGKRGNYFKAINFSNRNEMDQVEKTLGYNTFGFPPNIPVDGLVFMDYLGVLEHPKNEFIWCASKGNLDQLKESMCVNSLQPYDACLELESIVELAENIYETGEVKQVNKKVKDIFSRPQVGIVKYENVINLWGQQRPARLPDPSPFVKDVQFKDQSEIRIVMEPLNLPLPDRITIFVPRLETMFSEKFRNFKPKPDRKSESSVNKEDDIKQKVDTKPSQSSKVPLERNNKITNRSNKRKVRADRRKQFSSEKE